MLEEPRLASTLPASGCIIAVVLKTPLGKCSAELEEIGVGLLRCV